MHFTFLIKISCRCELISVILAALNEQGYLQARY